MMLYRRTLSLSIFNTYSVSQSFMETEDILAEEKKPQSIVLCLISLACIFFYSVIKVIVFSCRLVNRLHIYFS